MYPILFQNNDFILYSYPLLMGIGWGIAYQIFFSLLEISRVKGQILFWGVFLSAWIGAKLFFILTSKENSELLLSSSFWTGGGFVFYGGLIAGFLFVSLFKLIDKSFRVTDLWPILPALTFGHAVGRIGCFLAGCCYGKPTEFFWSIYLHNEHRHPTQLLEAAGLFLFGIVLLKSKMRKTLLAAFYLIGYGLLRFGTEELRGDMIRGTWGFLTPSQWVSTMLILIGFMLLIRTKSKA